MIANSIRRAIYDGTQNRLIANDVLKKYLQNDHHRDIGTTALCLCDCVCVVFQQLMDRVVNCRNNYESVLRRVIALIRAHLPRYVPSPQVLRDLESFCTSTAQNPKCEPECQQVEIL